MKEGDIVRVRVPIEKATLPLIKFTGEHRRIVKKVKQVNRQGQSVYYYELEDCQSKSGTPYGFLAEWLKED